MSDQPAKPVADWTGKAELSVPVRLLPHLDLALYYHQKRNERKTHLKRNAWKPSEVAAANADIQRVRDQITEVFKERNIR